MKALITGANGFVGSHLVNHLAASTDYELIGTTTQPTADAMDALRWWQIDLRDADQVQTMLSEIQPDLIYHLAAQAFVPAAFKDPWNTLENNIKSQLNIFQTLVTLELDCKVLVASSAHVYGKIRPEENPVNEQQPFRPDNAYSVSKVVQDMLAFQYYLSHGLHIVRARAFNHIGPGQDTRFALPNFATQIAAAEIGTANPVIQVGNLQAERDFTDVRDVVRAYRLLIEKGMFGEVYHIASGQAYSIQHVLDSLLAMSTSPITVQQDESRMRPSDTPVLIGAIDKITAETGWKPEIPLQTSLQDILNDWRTKD